MSTFDIDQLSRTMVEAARESVANRWPLIQPLAEVEIRRLAASLEDVAQLTLSGAIDQSRARKLVQIHQLTARSVLCSIEGLGLLTAETAIQAAIKRITSVVNEILEFKLL